MKKTLPLLLGFLVLAFCVSAQSSHRTRASVNPLKDYAVARPAAGDMLPTAQKPANPSVQSKLTINEELIGETRYDLQSNTSTQNRFWVFDDGTAGATWTMGMNDPGYTDRGTGYNYFDGTSWGAIPTTRVESVRTGWPSYAPYGTNGEIIVSHNFTPVTGGLALSIRQNKGTGAWTELAFQGPSSHPDVAWPRMVTGGTDYGTIHMIYVTKSTVNGGSPYNGMEGAILYSRSSDGGVTWSPKDQQLTGMSSTEYYGFPADGYTWAPPKGDTIAFVVSDSWSDLFMMKSTDNGTTWTKTVIWEHPYPLFNGSSPIMTDTFYCPDGATSLAFDSQGKVHLCFGVNRAHSDGVGTFYFPFVDGIGYWNEDMPPFTSPDFKQTLNPDSLYNSGNLVAWVQDVNMNDTLDFLPGGIEVIGTYFLGLSSMPNILIDGDDNISLVYASVTEGKDNGTQNFRHIWSTYKEFTEPAWSEVFTDLTGSIIHNFDECVYPTFAPNSWKMAYPYAQIIYQSDEEPGLSVRGDEDAPTDNDITWLGFAYAYINALPEIAPTGMELQGPYPNPAAGSTSLGLELRANSDIQIDILSLTGQRVYAERHPALKTGAHKLSLHLDGIAPGLYLLNITNGEKQLSRKLIIQ